MRTLRIALAGLLVSVGLVALTAAPSQACSCISGTPRQQLDRADAVFTGTLTGVGVPPAGDVVSSADPVTYRFDVGTVYAGGVDATAHVASVRDGASCGLERMTIGREYLVFATVRGDELESWLCSGTAPVRHAPVDRVAELAGPGQVMWSLPRDWLGILAF